MENKMSRILVENIIKHALKNIKDDPERGIRNLIDMALQFSEGRFQQKIFSIAQTMLQNENSSYYDLVRNVVSYIDIDRLYTFGMNLGYNGYTIGAQRIRENEKKLHCHIPWAITMQIDSEYFERNQQNYHVLLQEGEMLGIYTWILFIAKHPEKVFSLAKNYSDSAFCIFCKAEDISAEFLDEASELYNIMIVIQYEENAAVICDTIRKMGLLYSVWYQYGQKDAKSIINGDLFSSIQQLSPVFTFFLPEYNCSETTKTVVYQAILQARNEQRYHTLLWDLHGDNSLIDSIISDVSKLSF